MTDWKHYGQRIEEHNGSKAHKDCAEAYMLQACEIQEAGMFSVQIDTTQDITSQDQCSVILRYVTDVVNETALCQSADRGDGQTEIGHDLVHWECDRWGI